MAGKFESEDRVQLKTGSPTMTVVGYAIARTTDGAVPIKDKYECAWFDGEKSQKAIFKEEDLKLIQKNNQAGW